jgi:serine/threonine protein kinase
MQFMEGGTLLSLLHEMKRLPQTMAGIYATEIILAISFLHKRGTVHKVNYLCVYF